MHLPGSRQCEWSEGCNISANYGAQLDRRKKSDYQDPSGRGTLWAEWISEILESRRTISNSGSLGTLYYGKSRRFTKKKVDFNGIWLYSVHCFKIGRWADREWHCKDPGTWVWDPTFFVISQLYILVWGFTWVRPIKKVKRIHKQGLLIHPTGVLYIKCGRKKKETEYKSRPHVLS